VFEGGWEALFFRGSGGKSNALDFWRAEPSGRFYLYRPLDDDQSEGNRSPEPMTVLDPLLVISRIAQAIAVPMKFAMAMGCVPEETTLHYAFRWSELEGRELSSWAFPERFVSPYRTRQHEVVSYVAVPLMTPISGIAPYVRDATAPLFAAFSGFALGADVTEDLTNRVLERSY
jgi:hypothetical protein